MKELERARMKKWHSSRFDANIGSYSISQELLRCLQENQCDVIALVEEIAYEQAKEKILVNDGMKVDRVNTGSQQTSI